MATLYRDLPVLDLNVTVDNHGRIDGWPEACWLSLPLRIDQPQFRVGVPGSVVDPATELLPDTSRHYCWTRPDIGQDEEAGRRTPSQVLQLKPGTVDHWDGPSPAESTEMISMHRSM